MLLLLNIFSIICINLGTRIDVNKLITLKKTSLELFRIVKFLIEKDQSNVQHLYLEKRYFSDTAINYFNQLLCSEDWSSVYIEQDTNLKFDTFNKLFKFYFELAFPVKSKKN